MKNPKVDAYISKAAPFARPILEKLRRLFHEACPEVEAFAARTKGRVERMRAAFEEGHKAGVRSLRPEAGR